MIQGQPPSGQAWLSTLHRCALVAPTVYQSHTEEKRTTPTRFGGLFEFEGLLKARGAVVCKRTRLWLSLVGALADAFAEDA